MKGFLILIVSLSFALTAFGQHPSREKIEYIIYGTYCGECVSHCAQLYKLDTNVLLFDTAFDYFKKFYSPDSDKRFGFDKQPLSQKKYLKAKKIMDSIPEILFESPNKRFGTPDEHDQCGIFLQIKTSDKLNTFYIDTNLSAIPIELRNYATLIMEYCYKNSQ